MSVNVETVVQEELHKIAPDVGIDDIDKNANLMEEFDIDSMDFLNLVAALSERLNAPMPESDYPQMNSFAAMVGYLDNASGQL